ncbi:hypothetical protein IMZ48_35300 [Candidatus Bathyarchaeota archaeon]|nr:hypothetical protein [Candidatus Bathyarchaeota archaeon]
MHAISTFTLLASLASLASGVLAQSIGTFTTYTDTRCAAGAQEINVTSPDATGTFEGGQKRVRSVRNNLQSCASKSRHPHP